MIPLRLRRYSENGFFPWSHFAIDESPLAGSQLALAYSARMPSAAIGAIGLQNARPWGRGQASHAKGMVRLAIWPIRDRRPSKNNARQLEAMSHSSRQLHHHYWRTVGSMRVQRRRL
ncbi:hypothetical protein HBI67_123200 [Parastagonospora nodorum]|nr:hypothetical protein HBI66_203710 [Parastagonospora nodorum]KAH6065057.1 hypothetical protein HBI67_123200 [Parastagonospora nodorum]